MLPQAHVLPFFSEFPQTSFSDSVESWDLREELRNIGEIFLECVGMN